MKKEASKKNLKWIWLVIGIVVLVAALAVGAFLLFGQGEEGPSGPVGGKAEIYWNVDRLTYTENSVTGLSTREPGEDGLYHITFAIDGSQVEHTVADKKLVNSIDAMDTMGLVFGDDGTVVDVVPADTLATLGATGSLYVKTYKDGVITVNSSTALNGMELQFNTGDLTGIYNCSRTAEMVGEVDELWGMDRVLIYLNDLSEVTHVFITDRAPETDVYWRLDQYYDSTNVVTTRTPDENGAYTIPFAVNGEHVELKCKDKDLVTEIDKMNTYNCATGLVFDEEGYIVELISAGLAVRGTAEATQFTVTEITETTFMTTRIIPGNNQGSQHGGGLTPETKVYNVNTSGEVFGEETDLRLGDTVFCLIGSDGNAKIIYVVNRMVESSIYYNLSRSYDSTTRETTREMVNGRYEFELAADGTTIKVWTKDKAIASKMDSYTRYCFGLKLSDDNEVLKVYDPENVTGWTSSPNNLFVSSITGRIAAFVSSVSDFTLTAPMTEDCKVYDISDMAKNVGEPTELRVNDRCQGYRNINGEIVVIFVTARQVDGQIAWNTSRKYSDTTLETTREPDENGYYVYDVIIDGKERTVKTASKALATKIDEKKPGAVGLQLSGDIVTGVYEAHNIVGGTKVASTFYVKEFTETGFVADYVSVTGNGYWKSNVTWADEYVVYNVSRNFNDHRGEKTTLKIGDRIHCIRDKAAKTIIVFVYEREVDCEPYMKLDRFYDKATAQTTREPDENGWYNFQIMHKGEVKTYRTKDKEIASSVDYYSYFFALVADGDIILRALPVDYVKGVTGTLAENYDIMSINSSLTKATMYKHYPGDTDVGTETELTFASNCKFIDFCVYSETFGQEVKPQVGDRVYSLRGEGGKVLYACITKRVTHEGGYQSVCPHCDKEVWWEPWYGGNVISQDQLHYYLPADYHLTSQMYVGNTSRDFEVIFDLNGMTLSSDARGIMIDRNDKIVILDTSKAQTGKVIAKGPTNKTGGGVIQVAEGAEMTIYGGTYMLDPEQNEIGHGAVAYVTGAKMNILGGTFLGGECTTYGGNIYVRDGDFSAKNATFSGGKAGSNGGIFYMDSASRPVTFENCVLEGGSAPTGGNVHAINKIDFIDCTIKGGNAESGNGGNISIWTGGEVTLSGKTTVTGGTTLKNGGNIFISKDSTKDDESWLVIKDQVKISDGTAAAAANLGAGNAVVDISILGGTIEGDVNIRTKTNLTLAGAPVITEGSQYGLNLEQGAKIDATGLSAGSQICVKAANGVFTTDFADAAAAEAAKAYFTAEGSSAEIKVEGNALAMTGSSSSGSDDHPEGSVQCPSCGEYEIFLPWTDDMNTPSSGHYKLEENITVGDRKMLSSGELCIDLNGKTLKMASTLNTTLFYVQDGAKLVIMDSSADKTGKVIGNQQDSDPSKGRGIIQAYSGNVDIYGGTFLLNEDSVAGGGGIIRVSRETNKPTSVVNIYGGEFYGATATTGGVIHATVVDLNIQGGTFHKGTATNGDTIYLKSAEAKLTIGGNAVIDSGSDSIYVANAASVKLAEGVKIDATGLEATAQVAVNANGVFTTDFADVNAANAAMAKFTAQGGGTIAVEGKALSMTGGSTEPEGETCEHCGQQVTWTVWNGTTMPTPAVGHYVLEADTTVDDTKILKVSGDIVIDLAGNKLQIADGKSKLFRVDTGVKLVIMDSSAEGTGEVIGYQSGANNAGIAQLYGGSMDIYGGTFYLKDGATALNGGLFRATTNTTTPVINIYGGTFRGIDVTGNGSILSMTNAKLNITGGNFLAGNAPTGGKTIYVGNAGAELSISGNAVFESEVFVANAASVKLADGHKIDATGLDVEPDRQITVDANGVFTTDFADAAAAEAAKALFSAQSGNITVQGNALAVTGGSTEPDSSEPTPSEPAGETCEHCGQQITWTEWRNDDATPVDGHYRLAENVTMTGSKTLNDGNELVIDLAGNKLELASGKNKMFTLNDGAKIVFMDSSAAGTGEVIGYQNGSNAGIAQIYGGSMDIYGGTFRLRDGASALNGGLFRITSNTKTPVVNIKAGTFYGSDASNGGIISMTYATLNISGGTFYPGSASGVGDAIQVNSAKANVTISGDAVIYGGIEVTDAESITISGNPTIVKAAENGSAYSIKLAAGKSITVGELAETAQIGVTGSGTVVKGYPTAPDAIFGAQSNFVADEATKFVAAKGEELVLSEKPTADTFDCPHCDETVTWQIWDGTAKPAAAGHYYLNDNVAPKGNFTLADYGTVVLNLNGYAVYKANSGNVFLAQGATELVFMDSSADQTGTVVANNNTGKDGVIANAYQTGSSVTIYGGNYLSGTPDVSARNGGLLYVNGGTVTINGGEFWGTTTKKGGVVTAKAGTLVINSGVFHPGTASTAGDTICIEGTANVTIGGDAIIEGGVEIVSAGSVTLTGTPVIQKNPHGATTYSLKTAAPITVGALADGAKIAVNKYNDETKLFTAAFADEAAAKAAATYFYSDDPANAIVLDGTALGLQARAEGVADLKDPSNDKTLNILMVGNSFCYYYVEELYGLLMNNLPEGVEEVQIYNLYESGCELSEHLEWWQENSSGDGYQLFKTNASGRVDLAPSKEWTLEMALEQENWDYISLQGASTGYSYTDQSQWDNIKSQIAAEATPLLGRMYELFPNAQLLWHRTWAYEVGRISGSTVYDEAMLATYDAGIQEISNWMTTQFDQDKPYDLQMVNSGAAWVEARELNETANLLPIGGLCARKGVANADTYQYAKDHPDATDVGDGYHDGNIGGGQLLNAYVWYKTITGDAELNNNYVPATDNLAGYALSSELVAMLKQAAVNSFAAN